MAKNEKDVGPALTGLTACRETLNELKMGLRGTKTHSMWLRRNLVSKHPLLHPQAQNALVDN